MLYFKPLWKSWNNMQTKACRFKIKRQLFKRLQCLLSITSNVLQPKCTFKNVDKSNLLLEMIQFIKSDQVQLQSLQTADMNQPPVHQQSACFMYQLYPSLKCGASLPPAYYITVELK